MDAADSARPLVFAQQLDELCQASSLFHGSSLDVPTDFFFVLPTDSVRPDDPYGATPALERWKTTPSRIGALLDVLRAEGFVARLFRSSSIDSLGIPIALYLELGVPEEELIDDAQALQMAKRCKRIWGGKFGFLHYTRARATVDLSADEQRQRAEVAPAAAADASPTGRGEEAFLEDGARAEREGIYEWYADCATAAGPRVLRRFTSAERLRILLDKLDSLSTVLCREDAMDGAAIRKLITEPGGGGAGCVAARARAAARERAVRAACALSCLRAADGMGGPDRGGAGAGGGSTGGNGVGDDGVSLAGPNAPAEKGGGGALAYFSEAVPAHEQARRRFIRSMWVYRTKSAFRQMFSRLPGERSGENELLRELDALHEYFGSQVALYFAFATQLMMWLAMPAIVGLAFFVTELFVERVTVGLVPAYCGALMVWATLFAEFASRKKELLAFRWGGSAVADDEVPAGSGAAAASSVQTRPAYKLLLRAHGIDPDEPDPIEVSARVERTWRRRLRLLASNLSVGASTLVVLLAMAANLALRLWLARKLPRDGPIVGGLVTGLTIQLLGAAFKRVAEQLTEWECWRTVAQHEDALIAKLFLFECFNNYSSLFYIAFVRAHISQLGRAVGLAVPPSEECARGSGCLQDLEMQLASILFAKAILFKAIAVATVKLSREGRRFYRARVHPLILWCLRRRAAQPQRTVPAELRTWRSRSSLSSESLPLSPPGRPPRSVRSTLSAAAECASVAEADLVRMPASNVIDEYKELVIMYGYMVLFASAFPLAPFLCLISTGLELRADAFKFCEARRPLPRAARHHPRWFDCMHLLTTAAIVTNIGLVLFTVPHAMPDRLPLSAKVGALLFVEHTVLLARWSLQVLVPNKPIEVLRGLLESKLAFKRLHSVLLRAHAEGRGGGGGLSYLELMHLGLYTTIARDLKDGRARDPKRRTERMFSATGGIDSARFDLKEDYFVGGREAGTAAKPVSCEPGESGEGVSLLEVSHEPPSAAQATAAHWRLGWLRRRDENPRPPPRME